ncbi:MAG TPA: DNA cytosine methyltransferase [Kiloniellales bacterium]
MRPAYYNEIDPYCAEWLRNLIAAGRLPAGEVDDRDVREVSGDDLRGYGQVHLFAGVGGWAHALRLAGVADCETVWTGSCPCQPLSSAGQRKGHADERHLWPAFYRLVAERRPAVVLGEQVASRLGREWFAGVRADLEYLGYAIGAADLPAAGVGAPHNRARLFWAAYADGAGWSSRNGKIAHLGHRRAVVAGGGRRFWDGFEAHEDDHGRLWRSEPGTFPLAHGVPARVGKLRAYGNAVAPPLAAVFVRAAMEATDG